MRISVIIPTYRPQSYIWECLDSLCGQTLDKSQFEVIVVLNGCCDPWLTDINRYIEQQMDKMNVRLVHTEEAGVSHARNMGIEMATGEYIAFIDDDDYVSPSYLEELLKSASETNITLSDSVAFNDKEMHVNSVFEQSFMLLHNKGMMPYQKARKFFSVCWIKLIHRDMIGDRRFDTRFRNNEDSLFMFLLSNRFQTVSFTSPKAVYYRRLRPNAAHYISLGETCRNALKLVCAYSAIYWKHTREYSFRFYTTRLLGAVHQIIDAIIK